MKHNFHRQPAFVVASTQRADILPSLFGANGSYNVRPSNFYLSFLLHTAGVIVLLLLTRQVIAPAPAEPRITPKPIDLTYAPPIEAFSGDSGGRGGAHDLTLPSRGTPPKTSLYPITPPMVVVHNPNPFLQVESTIQMAPQIKLPQSPVLGDLTSVLNVPSSGVGGGSGIGTAPDGEGGIGSHGRGASIGAHQGMGGGITAPRAIYKVDPEFSEEARKNKYQGTAIIEAEIGADGLVHTARIARSLGMGLDEKALEAVRQWRFEPARMDGKPVAVKIDIEVGFKLY